MASALEAACFKCNTTLNVTEVGKGIFCCRGFCLKIFNHQKERLQAGGRSQTQADSSSPWQPGGFCRAQRQSDGQLLEATVDTVETDAEGRPFSRVTFIGYGTHEAKAHKDLKPSRGAAARKAQLDQAGSAMPEKKDWSVGDHCRAVFQDDGVEYEGTVRSIDTDGEGNRYANILYIGYENEETQWLTELKPSQGHGCQMAIARFLDRMCLALRASGLWLRCATLQNLIPSFPWIAPPRPPPRRNPRKGRDQILPSSNLDLDEFS